jgi:hypothetical protein
MEFEVALTTMGWEFSVEGEAHRQYGKLEISRMDEDRNIMEGGSKITNYLETRAMMQMDYEKELFLMYGSGGRQFIDKNTGKVITTSPGLMEYFECAQEIPFSPEVHGIDFITEQMDALWFDRIPVASREVVYCIPAKQVCVCSPNGLRRSLATSAASYDYSFVLNTAQPYDKSPGRKGFEFSPHPSSQRTTCRTSVKSRLHTGLSSTTRASTA